MPVITPAQWLVEEEPDSICGPRRELWIGDPGGLTQFGALIQVLPPGARSALKHWHMAEDELVYLLAGEVWLIEGPSQTLLRPGDAATFPAGVALGHCLENRGTVDAHCLTIGTRAARDVVTYPDHDRVLHRDDATGQFTWTDSAGRPADNPYARRR